MPQSTFPVSTGANDGEVNKTGVAYPPDSVATVETTALGVDARKRLDAGTYMNKVVLLRFDTSALPNDATVTGATLRLNVAALTNADTRTLNVEYVTDGAIAAGDYADLVGTNASTRTLSTISVGGNNDLTLSNLGSISLTAITKLRLGISGGAPTGTNEVTFSSFEGSPAPSLIVDYTAASVPAISGYAVSNETTDRTFDANATTVAEMADVLGTLIEDLSISDTIAGYTVTNAITDRVFNASSYTDAELADVLGTVISDYQTSGFLSGYAVSNYDTDRTFDADTAVSAELADVLATLIFDLNIGSGVTTPYTNPQFINRFKGDTNLGMLTHWNPSWRAWLENLPARFFKNAMGMCFSGYEHFTEEKVANTMELLARNGVKQIRLFWEWSSFSYYDPAVTTGSYAALLPALLRQAYAHGITPVIMLNQDPGHGTPWKVLTATVDNGAGGAVPDLATTLRLTNIALGAGESGNPDIIPNRTGLYHSSSLWPEIYGSGPANAVPNYFFTAFNSSTGIATLSRRVLSSTGSIAAGTYNLYTTKMMPFKDPPTPQFDESWAIWRDDYMKRVLNIVATEYPSREIILEVWNELSFQPEWLQRGLWYDEHDIGIPAGYEILKRVLDWIRDPVNGWTMARAQNGVTNTLPAGQSKEPAGSSGMGAHPYGSDWVFRMPFSIGPGRAQVDALGGNMSGGGSSPISTTTTGTNDMSSFAGSGVLNVVSAASFPSPGYIQVPVNTSNGATLYYTGKTSDQFTGCTKISGGHQGQTVGAGTGVYYHEWQPDEHKMATPEFWLEMYTYECRSHNLQPGYVGNTDFGDGSIKGRDVKSNADPTGPAPGFVITESGHGTIDWQVKAKGALRWYVSWISKGTKQMLLFGSAVSAVPAVSPWELCAPWLHLDGAHTFPMTNGTISIKSDGFDPDYYPNVSASTTGIGDTLMIGTDPSNLVTYTAHNSAGFTGCNGGFGGSLPDGTYITLREGGPAMEAIGRLSRFLSMAHEIPSPRTITVPQVSDIHDDVQWSGNTANLIRWPHLYDRDVLFVQPLQVSGDTFAIIYYVATRNMNAGNVDDGGSSYYGTKNFTIRLNGIRGGAYVKRKMDPLTDSTTFPVTLTNFGATSIDMEVEATDYPRLVLLREPMHSRIS